MLHRVVVTGLGCVTPLGADVAQVWRRLLRGESGVGSISTFDASSFPVRIAAEVRDWDLRDVGESPERWEHEARQTQFLVGAAIKAARDAGVDDTIVDPVRFSVMLGCGEVFPNFERFAAAVASATQSGDLDLARFLSAYRCQATPGAEFSHEPGAAIGHLAGILGAQGPSSNFTNACVSSSAAIGEALRLIQRGEADVVVAGGAHSMIHAFGVSGFHQLSTLSTRNDDPVRASRPFDRDRDGFVVGEGASVVVLENLDFARRRSANILAELAGYGASHDAYRITDPRPDARGAARCIELTLQDAELNLEDINYINAHGSSTAINDQVETAAIKSVFWREGLPDPDLEYQEHDRAPHDSLRCAGIPVLRPGNSRQRRAADDQLRDARSELRSGLHPQRSPRDSLPARHE